jgi:hypothetical protein
MSDARTFPQYLALALLGLAGVAFGPSAQTQTGTTPPSQSPYGQGKHFSARPAPSGPVRKAASGEEFFIVASVDQQKSQILLKHPTEVTLLARVDGNTRLADETGKPLKLSDFRAGDTVWVTLAGGQSGAAALNIRKGEMTVAELHRYYLDYPEIK